jgi:SNF2 family DNA or RNA helicase
MIKIGTYQDKFYVSAPYQPLFVTAIRMIPGAEFGDIDTGEAIITKVWTVPVSQEQRVRDLLEEHYSDEMIFYRNPETTGKNCHIELWSGFRDDASQSTIKDLTKEEMRIKWTSLIKDRMTIRVEAYEDHNKLAEWIKPYRMSADLSAGKSHIDITSKYEDKDIIKSMPGAAWDMTIKKWKLPLSRASINKLQGYDSKISNEIYEAIVSREKETAELQDIAHSKDIRISHPMGDKLRDYQRTGVKFLTMSPRSILGDDMGLGKSSQAMVACDELGCKKTLLIVPNTLKRNWAREYQKWNILPEDKITVVSGDAAARKSLINDFHTGALIINYDNVRPSGTRDTNLDDLLKKEWDAVIIDEGHKIKHYDSQQTIGVKQLAHSAKKACYVLTGTPPGEIDFIWNLLNAVRPDLYPDRWKFIREHGSVSKRTVPTKHGLKEITDINPSPVSPKRFKEEVLDPLMIRRLKSDKLKELPEKQYREVWIDMEPAQSRIYDDMMKREFAQIAEDKTVNAATILSKLNRLRQIAVSPDIMAPEISDMDSAIKRSNKIQAMLDIINGISGKVLVFSQYERAVTLACAALDKERPPVPYVRYTGKENEKVRDVAVEKFMHDPSVKVMLMTTAAGGLGLTLTAATDAIFLDKMWNPEDNSQAEDRIHRIGQNNHVTIHELLSENTLDEWVEGILKSKTSIDASVMDIVNKYHDSLAIAKAIALVSHKEHIGNKKAIVRQMRVPPSIANKQVHYKIASTGINKLTT